MKIHLEFRLKTIAFFPFPLSVFAMNRHNAA